MGSERSSSEHIFPIGEETFEENGIKMQDHIVIASRTYKGELYDIASPLIDLPYERLAFTNAPAKLRFVELLLVDAD